MVQALTTYYLEKLTHLFFILTFYLYGNIEKITIIIIITITITIII